MENPKMSKKVAGFFAKKGEKKLAAHEYREAAGKEEDTPAIAKREMKALKGAPAGMKNYEKKEHKAMGMKRGGMASCYAEGGMVKKPYKPTPGDLNEKSGGDQEMKMRRDEAFTQRGLNPDANYDREMRNVLPAKKRTITRNDKDLAAQSRIDELYTGKKNKTRGGGPGQREGIDYAKGGGIKMYAAGGMVRADGCATKGKTKGRFV